MMAKYQINSLFFNQPNIQNCYWAGFIAADGHIRKDVHVLEINLAAKDKEILENLKKDIGYTGEIKYRENLNQYRLLISNKQIVTDLKNNFRIENKKTWDLEPPENLDLINSLSYIRGFIDGDGSIYHNKQGRLIIKVIGTFNIVTWIKETLQKVNPNKIGKSKIDCYSAVYEWRLHGKNAKYFINILNSLDTFRLKRKWLQPEITKIEYIDNYTRNWIIGRFLPSIFTTDKFEVACIKLPKGYIGDKHYHKIATEYNILIYGKAKLNYLENNQQQTKIIESNAIFIYEPNEVSDVEYLEDSCVVTIKVPSINNDKYKV